MMQTLDEATQAAQQRLLERRCDLGIPSAPSAPGPHPPAGLGPARAAPADARPFALPDLRRRAAPPMALAAMAFGRLGAALGELRERCRARGLPTTGPTWDALVAFEPTKGWQAVRERLAAGRLIVVATGNVGAGKTVILAHLCLWDERPGRQPPCFIHAGAAFEALGFPHDDERRGLWRRMERTDLLALDDLGTETLEERGLAAFRELFVRRYDAGRITLATTNFPREDLAARYFDDRLADRFEARGVTIQLAGRSRRRRAR